MFRPLENPVDGLHSQRGVGQAVLLELAAHGLSVGVDVGVPVMSRTEAGRDQNVPRRVVELGVLST